ncbi:hypothetical protein Enr13x_22560 [Stieleria neptunia]|uniref:Uncharacterized protein n=1 Tax=Stieleria neptunia TaxID=2527979 RepID=A0A518HNK8_9BACT|nr:hypothetical protein Enr13x_22560 [Stieleria neptunia]
MSPIGPRGPIAAPPSRGTACTAGAGPEGPAYGCCTPALPGGRRPVYRARARDAGHGNRTHGTHTTYESYRSHRSYFSTAIPGHRLWRWRRPRRAGVRLLYAGPSGRAPPGLPGARRALATEIGPIGRIRPMSPIGPMGPIASTAIPGHRLRRWRRPRRTGVRLLYAGQKGPAYGWCTPALPGGRRPVYRARARDAGHGNRTHGTHTTYESYRSHRSYFSTAIPGHRLWRWRRPRRAGVRSVYAGPSGRAPPGLPGAREGRWPREKDQ